MTTANDEGRTNPVSESDAPAAEPVLEPSEACDNALRDAIPICVWAAHSDGHIYCCNRAWREYAGAEAGLDFCSAVPEPERDHVARSFREAVRNGQPLEWEQRLRRRDGAQRWHLCRMVPARDASGKLLGGVLTATDIHAHKQIATSRESLLANEKELRKLAESATRANDEFLAIVSHELRTPLGAILGWTRMLRTGMVGRDGLAHALESIERSAAAQARLLDDLFDRSRIVSGKLRVDVRRMDLHQTIRDAADLVQPSAKAKGVIVELSLEDGSAEVAGDPERLQQVVWNLLTNAIKFTPRSGCVTVLARRQRSEIVIEVRDTGVGIPRDFLPYVFDRFRQADSRSRGRANGLGLGLAIVRDLVELHGGVVRAFSRGEGMGSTFTVRLPSASPPAKLPRRITRRSAYRCSG